MERIHQKALREHAKESYQQMLDALYEMRGDSPVRKEEVLKKIDEMIRSTEQSLESLRTPAQRREAWDFSMEKSQTAFVYGNGLLIRPITTADEEFYFSVWTQYSLMYRDACKTAKDNRKSILMDEMFAPQAFYCIICDAEDSQPMGYLGVKDTSAEIWEIAIELDGKYTHQGFGSESLRLYLNEVWRRTGVGEFRAVVEVDNIPSQRCFEGLGAELVGLCDSFVLRTEDEKKRFEERNLQLIDAHMTGLAKRLGVEPRKLLSHLLDYRLKCPL